MASAADPHGSYIREKLRGARDVILAEGPPTQERIRSAYVYNLSSLQFPWFLDQDARDEFRAINRELTHYGEAMTDAGSVPTTLWTMSDDQAEALATRIVALADRYLA